MNVPNPNLKDKETVFVRPLAIDQLVKRDSASVPRTTPSIAQWVPVVHKPSHHGGMLLVYRTWSTLNTEEANSCTGMQIYGHENLLMRVLSVDGERRNWAYVRAIVEQTGESLVARQHKHYLTRQRNTSNACHINCLALCSARCHITASSESGALISNGLASDHRHQKTQF
ncbi:hypothetical protein CLF_100899 [Clonorchis sinensis]|uniref:Uncharacterized protein n=1 Tax=Clonorchis sinensis TaxID=79923 RepID=G7Y4I1_CLOSI|nr:hypothetical protein CLF_100899 [Clonorchis sinensis]